MNPYDPSSSAQPPQPAAPPPVPLFTSTAPPPVPAAPRGAQSGTLGGLIPTGNPNALTAYYLAVFSLIPVLGLVLGSIAVALGLSGLKKYKKDPLIRGATHAWVGIIVGGGVVLLHLVLIAWIIYAAIMSGK